MLGASGTLQLLLALTTLAHQQQAIISRGELIEIGGSFRLPDIMATSGSQLCEVGTTNKTRISDYAEAVCEATGVLLKVHPSNFQVAGYFFFGGLSAGAYLLARLAARLGRRRLEPIHRAGTWVAMVTMLPCPPLLIHDLGDPKRFHHMLRIFKPGSPMNLGTFALTGYGGLVTAALLRPLNYAAAGRHEQRRVKDDVRSSR